MTCNTHQESISMMMDNELEDHHFPDLLQHLSRCNECRQFFQSGLNLRSAFAIAKPIVTPRRLDERMERIAFGKRKALPLSAVEALWRTRISFPLPAAASIAILIVIGSLLLLPVVLEEPKTPITISSELLYKTPSSLVPEAQRIFPQEESKER